MKDEEDVIGRCLETYAVVDEIIIVDTGSADRTRAICEQYGVTVIDDPWDDDFSRVRNAGIRKASSDWILWLDADEVLEQDDAPLLRRTLNTASESYLAIHLINFYGGTASLDASFQIAHTRLFRNHMGTKFEGKIHEHLNLTDVRDIVDIPVYHYGYMHDVAVFKGVALMTKQRRAEALKSFRRCLALGEGEWRYLTMRGVGSFLAWYYIGKCSEFMGEAADAQAAYREAMSISPTYSPAAEALEQQ